MFSIFHPVPEQQFKVKLSRLIMLKWLTTPQTQRPPTSQDALTHRRFAMIIFHPCLGMHVIIKYHQCSILWFFQEVLSKEKGFPLHCNSHACNYVALSVHCTWQTTLKWIPLQYQLKTQLSHPWAPCPMQSTLKRVSTQTSSSIYPTPEPPHTYSMTGSRRPGWQGSAVFLEWGVKVNWKCWNF